MRLPAELVALFFLTAVAATARETGPAWTRARRLEFRRADGAAAPLLKPL